MNTNSGDGKMAMVEASFRLPEAELDDLELAAEACLMNRSEYLRFLVQGRPVQADVGLAALRRLIQIHGLAQENDAHGDLASSLRELIPILAKAVRHRLV